MPSSARDLALGIGLAVALSACGPPARLQGPVAEIGIDDARHGVGIGERVRWGGTIVRVKPRRDRTCFEIVARPLDMQARPHQTDETEGRFRACAAGFYDPAVYAEDREVTVTGVVLSPTTGEIGDYEYEYPRVDADVVYLWRERIPEPVYYYDPWLAPYGGPYWGLGAYWYSPRVFGHRRHSRGHRHR